MLTGKWRQRGSRSRRWNWRRTALIPRRFHYHDTPGNPQRVLRRIVAQRSRIPSIRSWSNHADQINIIKFYKSRRFSVLGRSYLNIFSLLIIILAIRLAHNRWIDLSRSEIFVHIIIQNNFMYICLRISMGLKLIRVVKYDVILTYLTQHTLVGVWTETESVMFPKLAKTTLRLRSGNGVIP